MYGQSFLIALKNSHHRSNFCIAEIELGTLHSSTDFSSFLAFVTPSS